MSFFDKIIKALTGSQTPATDEKSQKSRQRAAMQASLGFFSQLENALKKKNYNQALEIMEKNQVRLTLSGDGFEMKAPGGLCPGEIKPLLEIHKKGMLKSLEGTALTQDARGFSPLHRSAADDNADEACRWIKNGSVIDVGDNHGRTALHLAATFGCPLSARVLLDSGADPEKRDARGQTPLHKAAVNDHREMMEILTQAGADPETPDTAGDRCIHLSIANEARGCIAFLLNLKVDLDTPNCRGETPLSIARSLQDDKTIEALTGAGAVESNPPGA